MPELPEVEIVKQSLNKKIKGKIVQKVLVKNRNLRFKLTNDFEKKIRKKKVARINRFSKYIIIKFEDNSGFIIHLGMSGTIHIIDKANKKTMTNSSFYHSQSLPKKHNHIEIKFNKIKLIVILGLSLSLQYLLQNTFIIILKINRKILKIFY